MTRERIESGALTLVITAVLLAGCGNGGSAPADPDQAAIDSVPTAEEADAAAAESINAENAEEALDDLLEEIDSDLAGGG
ncbi:MAG: hypothetical protein ACYTGG_00200 [Planctomycetota bacterium]